VSDALSLLAARLRGLRGFDPFGRVPPRKRHVIGGISRALRRPRPAIDVRELRAWRRLQSLDVHTRLHEHKPRSLALALELLLLQLCGDALTLGLVGFDPREVGRDHHQDHERQVEHSGQQDHLEA
jgi:hypothetical protein